MAPLTTEIQSQTDLKFPEFFQIKKTPKANFSLVILAVLTVVVIIAAYIINNEFANLERSINMQAKSINDLTALIISNKNLSDSQIQILTSRLKDEADVRKIEVNNVSLVDNDYYINIMKAITANTKRMNELEAKPAPNITNPLH
jgi:hypothetical protein